MTANHRGVWRPEDRAESRYAYLPVDVPPGTGHFTVTLSYDPGGVLDLGCFAPDGSFRGWSGGARTEFTIGADSATPGYLAGPLEPGTWQVVLGLHRVPPEGLPWRVTFAASRGPASVPPAPAVSVPARGPRRTDLPAPDGLTWLAADLHAHTAHSDGALTVPELAALAIESGLDILAVTDHNTTSHHGLLSFPELVLIPGQEVTTDRGHANAFGDVGWVDFRRPAAEWVSTVASRGGLLSINHPLGGDCAWLHETGRWPPLAEVWHSGWFDRTWGAPLAWWGAAGRSGGSAVGVSGFLTPVGGSDFHRLSQPERPGRPTTWLACAERSVAAALDALAAGRVAIAASPTGPVVLRHDGDLVVLGGEGTMLVDFSGRRRLVRGDPARMPGEAGPHWLEDYRAQILAIVS